MASAAGVVLTLTDLALTLTLATEAPDHLAGHERSEVAFFGSFLEPGTCLVAISLPEPASSGAEGIDEAGGKDRIDRGYHYTTVQDIHLANPNPNPNQEERGAKSKRSALGLVGKRKPPPPPRELGELEVNRKREEAGATALP